MVFPGLFELKVADYMSIWILYFWSVFGFVYKLHLYIFKIAFVTFD